MKVALGIAVVLTFAMALGAVGCASQSKSCCGPEQSCCTDAAAPRDRTPRELTIIESDPSPIRQAFNALSDRWRVVSLVSPTCSECVYGAEAVRKEITDRYSADRVGAISIWIPMVPTDSEQAARASATIFPEKRAVQFYDARQAVGSAYARETFAGFVGRARKSLPQGHYLAEHFANPREVERPAWDLYMLYAPGVRWEQSPPLPTHWIRHCGRTDGQKSTYWIDSPDSPPREGKLFDAMRAMTDAAVGPPISAASSGSKVELLSFPSCPYTPAIRKSLSAALTRLRGDSDFADINLESLAETDSRRGWGAPTILVNGRDLMGMPPPTTTGLSCRAYSDGLPSEDEIGRRLSTSADASRCALTPAELQAKRPDLLPSLRDKAEQVTRLENGFRLRFASRPGTLGEITRVIEQERSCCSFLQFKIEIEPNGGPIALEVTGPPGTREMFDKL